jgi:putative oxidoreductase
MAWAQAYGEWSVLALRIATGLVFFMHGWQKLQGGVPGVAGFLTSLSFPMPEVFAVLLITGEVVGGLALILGVWTRLASLVLVIIAVVALFTVHVANGFFISNGGIEFILLLLVSAFTFFTWGGGKYSVDAKIGM